jgi:hypothetical protein
VEDGEKKKWRIWGRDLEERDGYMEHVTGGEMKKRWMRAGGRRERKEAKGISDIPPILCAAASGRAAARASPDPGATCWACTREKLTARWGRSWLAPGGRSGFLGRLPWTRWVERSGPYARDRLVCH